GGHRTGAAQHRRREGPRASQRARSRRGGRQVSETTATTTGSYLSEEEREQFLEAAGHGMTLAFWARRQPDVPAVICEHGDRTFAELNGRANQLARALRDRGMEAGDSLGLMM